MKRRTWLIQIAFTALVIAVLAVCLYPSPGTRLVAALNNGNWQSARDIIRRHPSAHQTHGERFGLTPLHLAVSGPADLVQLLIEAGADVDEANNQFGATPLHRSIFSFKYHPDYLSVMELLLDAGAMVDAKNAEGITPLHWCANFGSLDGAKLLLDKGADPNARAEDGQSPLHMAVCGSASISLVELLLERGADVNARAYAGQTALHFLADADIPKRPGTASKADIATVLLAAGADPVAQDDVGFTPLHRAALSDNSLIAKVIVGIRGVAVNALDKTGNTALDVAVEKGSKETAQVLRACGATRSE